MEYLVAAANHIKSPGCQSFWAAQLCSHVSIMSVRNELSGFGLECKATYCIQSGTYDVQYSLQDQPKQANLLHHSLLSIGLQPIEHGGDG
jgi:hypothetical protein